MRRVRRLAAAAIIAVAIGATWMLWPAADEGRDVPEGELFALFLHEDRGTPALAPDELARVVDRYRRWASELASEGRLVRGEKLADEPGFHIRSGPTVERPARLGPLAGFFLVRARDYDGALDLARTCPHLEYGWIELRRIQDT